MDMFNGFDIQRLTQDQSIMKLSIADIYKRIQNIEEKLTNCLTNVSNVSTNEPTSRCNQSPINSKSKLQTPVFSGTTDFKTEFGKKTEHVTSSNSGVDCKNEKPFIGSTNGTEENEITSSLEINSESCSKKMSRDIPEIGNNKLMSTTDNILELQPSLLGNDAIKYDLDLRADASLPNHGIDSMNPTGNNNQTFKYNNYPYIFHNTIGSDSDKRLQNMYHYVENNNHIGKHVPYSNEVEENKGIEHTQNLRTNDDGNTKLASSLSSIKTYFSHFQRLRCNLCGTRFFGIKGAKRVYVHIVSTHLKEKVYESITEDRDPFKCIDPYCDYSANSKEVWAHHAADQHDVLDKYLGLGDIEVLSQHNENQATNEWKPENPSMDESSMILSHHTGGKENLTSDPTNVLSSFHNFQVLPFICKAALPTKAMCGWQTYKSEFMSEHFSLKHPEMPWLLSTLK